MSIRRYVDYMKLNNQDIAKLGEIATLLEVSGYPKPGNVHRTQDFSDMFYEDFLISSTSIRENLELVANNASTYYPGMLNQINVGRCIYGCIRNTQNLVKTNTNLGISMLLIPMAAAFGAIKDEDTLFNFPHILKTILENSSTDDAICLIKAISLANAGGLDNKTSEYDVDNKDTIEDIRRNNINLYNLFEMSASYDKISYELINGLPVILKYGYPTYAKYMNDYSKNDVTLEIYLTILANVPDTLITRKYGDRVAQKVSKQASTILKNTKIASTDRLNQLKEFDTFLRNNKYNPGTTADFTAASLFVGLVDKYSQSGI